MKNIAVILLISLTLVWACQQENQKKETQATLAVATPDTLNGVHTPTGFIAKGDYLLVISQCTSCHSSQIVTQSRNTRDGWKDKIRWMQATQKLWDLGPNEDKILDYLAQHYGPTRKGRRARLEVEEWYEIE